jgi:hypothetical protein
VGATSPRASRRSLPAFRTPARSCASSRVGQTGGGFQPPEVVDHDEVPGRGARRDVPQQACEGRLASGYLRAPAGGECEGYRRRGQHGRDIEVSTTPHCGHVRSDGGCGSPTPKHDVREFRVEIAGLHPQISTKPSTAEITAIAGRRSCRSGPRSVGAARRCSVMSTSQTRRSQPGHSSAARPGGCGSPTRSRRQCREGRLARVSRRRRLEARITITPALGEVRHSLRVASRDFRFAATAEAPPVGLVASSRTGCKHDVCSDPRGWQATAPAKAVVAGDPFPAVGLDGGVA